MSTWEVVYTHQTNKIQVKRWSDGFVNFPAEGNRAALFTDKCKKIYTFFAPQELVPSEQLEINVRGYDIIFNSRVDTPEPIVKLEIKTEPVETVRDHRPQHEPDIDRQPTLSAPDIKKEPSYSGFKVSSKKIFRPPWARHSPEPATFRKENHYGFQKVNFEEDDRPLSEIMSKTKTEPEDDIESSLNFTLNTQVSEDSLSNPSQAPFRCSSAFSQRSNPFEFTQERLESTSDDISSSQSLSAEVNKWANVESSSSKVNGNKEKVVIAKVEQCSSPSASCQAEA
ncbi:unnamed protein product [Oikopleura dioica]|uniref:5'-3' DNA helicase ZGRF1-like N-terminal domain-containing protein n=1 Tax=Oikopleura dioica TaxID=34765 RepID=E4XHC8_OIKDI|nr:unnamed protein product [Oikopleura dioica]